MAKKRKERGRAARKGRILLRTGEALVEDEAAWSAAEPEVVIGELDGPVGYAIANLLGDQTKGHSRVFAILNSDVQVRPATLMVSKVTVNDSKYTNILMGTVQAAIAHGVLDAVRAGDIPKKKANDLGIIVSVWIHPGTGAMCADDFLMLVQICDNDPCLAVNADPSHCWEGEGWETRFLKVGKYRHAAHVKNFVIRPGFPLRAMESSWPKRAMQFTDLPSGDLNMKRYVELLLHVGYRDRYCKLNGTDSAPLVVEAESAHRDLDHTSANGIAYVRDHCCWPAAGGSFEDGMGA